MPIAWLANLVLKLPPDARSSLKIDSLPLVGFTDVGRAAHGNQDRIAVAYSVEPGGNLGWLLAIVCDGVGGSSHGESAAAMAVASVALEIAGSRRTGATGMLRNALHRAHARTSHAFNSKSSTTAVALLVTNESAAIGWVGDSRAYQISDGKAALLTADDTLASVLARGNSALNIELNDEYADRLSQAIGGENSVLPNVISWEPSAKDAVCILCTDGIWKPTEQVFNALVDSCRDGSELMRRLLLLSNWMGGLDNASAILVPAIGTVREFICNPINATPKDFLAICLPGPIQTLLPLSRVQEPLRAMHRQNQDHRPDPVNEPVNKLKKPPAKKRVASAKARANAGLSTTGQLVIEEEPLDDASTQTPGKISGNEPSA